MGDYIVGIDIGGTKILTGIMDQRGRVLVRNQEATCSVGHPEEVMEQCSRMVTQMLSDSNITEKDILGIGAAVPGPLDYIRGIVLESPNLRWLKYPVRDQLSKRLGAKLLLDRDTNVAALGEFHYGNSKGCQNLIYITVSTGIGGSIIAEGKLLHGLNGGAGEVGHMVIEPGGRRCGCGQQGCLEALASGTALALEAGELIAQGQGQNILAFCNDGKSVTAREIGLAARQGDEKAQALINRAGKYLGIAVANLINIINPERIIIGGGMGLGLQDLLIPCIQNYVRANIFSLHSRRLQIETTRLGQDIVLLGCAAMVLKERRSEGNVIYDG